MKKYIILIFILASFMSCNQFDDVSNVDKIAYIKTDVNIDLNNIPPEVPKPLKYTIKFINYVDNYEVVKEVDANKKIVFDNVIPGIYTIIASAQVSINDFFHYYSGTLTNINITNNKSLNISLKSAKSGNLIIKEIYYCGSKTPTGGSYFRDQYYEIYNNSNKIVYADGLCFGNLLPLLASANAPTWIMPDGQKQEDYVFFDKIWQIPGNGTTYPIAPGESFIIAQMAANHQTENLNPNSPVNLISAEFETFIKSTSVIADNPAHNMNIAFWPGFRTPQWLVTVFGGAYAMFFPTKEIDFDKSVNQKGSSRRSFPVHIKDILDAVELVNDETKVQLKRIPTELDAGAIYVSGIYKGETVSRKIKEVKEDGRVIYWDTNNTTEDFQVNPYPIIRRNNAKIPSWNTWAKN